MLRQDNITRDVLAELLRGAVDDTVQAQLKRHAQEPQVTSKVAAEIERRLADTTIRRFRVSVVAQDFTDRGRGSGEWHSGADLYVGIRIELDDGSSVAKGLLIQAKKIRTSLYHHRDDEVLPRVSKEQRNLLGQCEKMLERTTSNAAFVWLYDDSGASVVPAQEVIDNSHLAPEALGRRSVGEQFRDVLDCFHGDPKLVDDAIFDDDAALGAFMERIAVSTAVAVQLVPVDR